MEFNISFISKMFTSFFVKLLNVLHLRTFWVSCLQAFLNQHCGELVSICEAYLSAVILNENGAQDLDEELMVSRLFPLIQPHSCHCKLVVTCPSPKMIFLFICWIKLHSDTKVLMGIQSFFLKDTSVSTFSAVDLHPRTKKFSKG